MIDGRRAASAHGKGLFKTRGVALATLERQAEKPGFEFLLNRRYATAGYLDH
jgi:hypothetical protein